MTTLTPQLLAAPRRARACSASSCRRRRSRSCRSPAPTPTSRRCSSWRSGCCAARWRAACSASASACSPTSSSLQTLGVSSLVLLGVGYGAGRLREARDPEGTLVPLAVGAAATLAFGVGFALVQFLLGVDAPRLLGAHPPAAGDARPQHPAGAAALRARAPLAARRDARRPAPPPPPRVHHRRPEPALARPGDPALMMESSGDRRAPITPQLALRVAILGGVAFALFAIVFFRLWYLQVLSGDKFLAQATVNRVREVSIQAPRGRIVDRNGKVIVAKPPLGRRRARPRQAARGRARDLAGKWAQDVNDAAGQAQGHARQGDPDPADPQRRPARALPAPRPGARPVDGRGPPPRRSARSCSCPTRPCG